MNIQNGSSKFEVSFTWKNKIEKIIRHGINPLNCLCFSPDGAQLLVATGLTITIFNSLDGKQLNYVHICEGIICQMVFSKDGHHAAIGDRNGMVTVCTSDFSTRIFRYRHNCEIISLSFNPMTKELASCSSTSFTIWPYRAIDPEIHLMENSQTICASSWSADGLQLALLIKNSHISIRNKACTEVSRIYLMDYSSHLMMWVHNCFIVAEDQQHLSFINNEGFQIFPRKNIGMKITCLKPFKNDWILVAGVRGWRIINLSGEVLSVMENPLTEQNHFIDISVNNTLGVADSIGSIFCYDLITNPIFGIYQDCYAIRENFSTLKYHISGETFVHSFENIIRNISLNEKIMAIKLSEDVKVFKKTAESSPNYALAETFKCHKDSCLAVMKDAVLYYQNTKLTLVSDASLPHKDWQTRAKILHAKVFQSGDKEELFLSLSNKQIWKYVNFELPELVVKISAPIKSFDVNATSSAIAVIDEFLTCKVYWIATGKLMFSDKKVSSVVWHSSLEELLCLSTDGLLIIKAGDFMVSSQPLNGLAVGFHGSIITYTEKNALKITVIHTRSIVEHCIDMKMFRLAYNIACMGVSTTAWEILGHAALWDLSTKLARKAFEMIGGNQELTMIDKIEEYLYNLKPTTLTLVDVLEYREKFANAVRSHRACDSRTQTPTTFYGAHRMPLAVGDVSGTTRTTSGYRWVELLLEKRKGSKFFDLKKAVANLFNLTEDWEAAAEVYHQLENTHFEILATVKSENWERAFQLAKFYPQYKSDIFIPYADLLKIDNSFMEAQKAYHRGGDIKQSTQLLYRMAKLLESQGQYKQASHYFWMLALQSSEVISISSYLVNTDTHYYKALGYNAYEFLCDNKFSLNSKATPLALFNAAKFLMLSDLKKKLEVPSEKYNFYVYTSILQQGTILGLNKDLIKTRNNLEQLGVPTQFQENSEITVEVPEEQGQYFKCLRCQNNISSLLLKCNFCAHKIYISPITFESLPIVAFRPKIGISHERCMELIRSPAPKYYSVELEFGYRGRQKKLEKYNFPLKSAIHRNGDKIAMTSLDLRKLNSTSVVVVKNISSFPEYFYNLDPKFPIRTCYGCNNMYTDAGINSETAFVCSFCGFPDSSDKLAF